MSRTRKIRVLFRAAAGSRGGYGHLVRCGVLARAMGVPREIVLRGSAETGRVARRLGWALVRDAEGALVGDPPDLIVVDDPSAAQAVRWVRRARRHNIPVATIHDLGLTRVPSDLQIDGSLTRIPGSTPAELQGPEFAILDPSIPEMRARKPPRDPHRVLITLGGGAHVRMAGATLARRISSVIPNAQIVLAAGFEPFQRQPLPPRCRWIVAPAGMADALATAAVAVVAGGLTLYEACALGTPIVAMPVVPAQRFTIRAAAAAGAAIDASASTPAQTLTRAADGVVRLLTRPGEAARQGARASRLVDGEGAARVARHLEALAASSLRRERRHVA